MKISIKLNTSVGMVHYIYWGVVVGLSFKGLYYFSTVIDFVWASKLCRPWWNATLHLGLHCLRISKGLTSAKLKQNVLVSIFVVVNEPFNFVSEDTKQVLKLMSEIIFPIWAKKERKEKNMSWVLWRADSVRQLFGAPKSSIKMINGRIVPVLLPKYC